jgi:hypothetical protein
MSAGTRVTFWRQNPMPAQDVSCTVAGVTVECWWLTLRANLQAGTEHNTHSLCLQNQALGNRHQVQIVEEAV